LKQATLLKQASSWWIPIWAHNEHTPNQVRNIDVDQGVVAPFFSERAKGFDGGEFGTAV